VFNVLRGKTSGSNGVLRYSAWRTFVLAGLVLGGAAACERSVTTAPAGDPAAAEATGAGAVGGFVVGLDGARVAGATVRLPNGVATRTDAAGGFTIAGLPATDRLAVTVEADRYASTTAIYRVVAGQRLEREIRLQPRGQAVTIVAGQGGVVPFANGGSVRIPADAFAGVTPDQPVTVEVTYRDPASPEQLSAAPGDFTTDRGERLETFGMTEIRATDTRGNRLELAPGREVVTTFPDPDGPAVSRPIQLWTFNPLTGRWERNGFATPNPDGTLTVPIGSIASDVNLDEPVQVVCIRVRALTPNWFPRAFQYVSAAGVSYAGLSPAWADAQGYAELWVVPGSVVNVTAGPASVTVNAPPNGPACPQLAAQLVF
jgi:Carboxypeptidase regulatory-like domain